MSERIRWGVLGCADIAEKVFNGAVQASQTGLLYAVASRDREKAREWQGRFGFQHAYGSYEELLESDQVDAVYIPLPNTLHARWAAAAARAGKHVLCEKPAGLNADEVEGMVAAAREAGVFFVENFAFRFHPQSFRLRELLDGGAIGDVLAVEASFHILLDPGNHRGRLAPEMGGGAAYDLGCYNVAFSRFVFQQEPLSVMACGDPHPRFGVDTTFSSVLDFGGNRHAVLYSSFEAPGAQRARIIGSRGEILLPAPYHPRRAEEAMRLRRYRAGSGEPEEERVVTPVIEPFTAAVDDLGRAIREGGSPILPAEDAIAQARVLDAALTSAREGRRIPVG